MHRAGQTLTCIALNRTDIRRIFVYSMKSQIQSAPARALRIFIVEDHADTLKYLALYLRDSGYEVGQARGSSEAIERLQAEDGWDVLLSDLNLPDGDGWKLMGQLHKLHCAPRIGLAMSGFGMGADKAKSAAAGFRYHLVKPLDPSELDRVLEQARRDLQEKPGRGGRQ